MFLLFSITSRHPHHQPPSSLVENQLPVALLTTAMKLLIFATFYTHCDSRIVWVVGNGPLVQFFRNYNDVGVTARMVVLEILVFWALLALVILSALICTVLVIKHCWLRSDGGEKEPDRQQEKESVSTNGSTSTSVDILGKRLQLWNIIWNSVFRWRVPGRWGLHSQRKHQERRNTISCTILEEFRKMNVMMMKLVI